MERFETPAQGLQGPGQQVEQAGARQERVTGTQAMAIEHPVARGPDDTAEHHGIALVTPRFEAQGFASGKLVALFDITASTGEGYYLAYPREQRSSRKIRLFRDWVLKEAAPG